MLRGLPHHFAPIKASSRFMNDNPPPLYTATVLWALVLPPLVSERGFEGDVDLEVTVADLVERLRRDFGYGTGDDVRAALEFLKIARLTEEGPSSWVVYFRDLSRLSPDIGVALLHEYRSQSNKTRPPRTAAGQAEIKQEAREPQRLFDA